MLYISTRGQAPATDFATTILDGLAPDGGLYVPEHVTPMSAAQIAALQDSGLSEITCRIVSHFAGDALGSDEVAALLARAYDGFTHPAITPLVQIGQDQWVMELIHGPTLAFKDLAIQVLAPLLGHFLVEADRTATIIGATSGDTGGAALAAFAHTPRVRALFLYPDGGVSPFQAAQMQALSRPGLCAVPVSGTFDNCQAIVKSILSGAHAPAPANLTAVNSVNWGRILAQTAYYARAALLLGHAGRPVHFVVPTGNFGNVYAGLLARRLGFAVGEMVVATNANDSLHRIVQTGRIAPRAVQRTHSPAMDIQVASNLERLIFDLGGAGAAQAVRGLFTGSARDLPPDLHQRLRKSVLTQSISDADTLAQISATQARTGYVADPHTAVALAAAGRVALPPGPVVCLATAHPVKFSETVAQALGRFPPHLDIAAHIAPVPRAPDPIQPYEQRVRDLLAKTIMDC